MVKFVAKQAANPMALAELGSLLLESPAVAFSNLSPTGYTITSGDVSVDVKGSGFTYPLGVPGPTGTIDKILFNESGALAYKLSGLDLDVGTFYATAAATADPEATVAGLFSGDDKFKGSAFDDTFAGGDGNDKFNGKDGDDTLIGNNGKDTFDGGKGSDIYDGGGGKDIYVFKDAPDSGLDKILKFKGNEKLKIDNKDFKGLGGEGKLDPDMFVVGNKATNGDQRFIYNDNTGALYHDKDGKGGAKQVEFAVLKNKPADFDHDNILII